MSPKIQYIDGIRLHRALVVGINRVLSRENYLNKINVFPVPDSDTGTNLALTFNSILEGTRSHLSPHAGEMCQRIADSALDGARGNSGVIMAQFFQGLSDSLLSLKRLHPGDFATGISRGMEFAQQAMADPRDGTILSVIRDFSEHILELIDNGITDFSSLIESGIHIAEKSLAETPEQLAVLKKAGVVDAGAQGFVDLLNGIWEFIQSGSIKDYKLAIPESEDSSEIKFTETSEDSLKFQFCTECILEGHELDINNLRNELAGLGDSLIVAGHRSKAKVHIHVNNPAQVFAVCSKYGRVRDTKADDMWHQHHSVSGMHAKIAIVTDSTADLPALSYSNLYIVPLRYHFGTEEFLDKISLSQDQFYQRMETAEELPKTSQPTPGDFRRQYQFLAAHYDSVISLHLPKGMSGTFQSAESASKKVPNTEISVYDTLTLSISHGLMVQSALEAVKDRLSHNEIISRLDEIRKGTELYAAIKDLSYAVRGGRIPRWANIIANLLKLHPILSTNLEGKFIPKGVILGYNSIELKLAKKVLRKLNPSKNYRIVVGHSNCADKANNIKHYLSKKMVNLKNISIVEIGGALAIHVGPGSVALGVQEAGDK